MPHTRSAYAAIRGYIYQFDRTILEILQCGEDDIITIEGAEDIDRDAPDRSTAIQCKYFEAQSFSLPLIRYAIVAMLADSIKEIGRQYRVYIHCGEASNFISKMDVPTLKECLTKTIRKPRTATIHLYSAFTHEQLTSFVDRLTLESGDSFDAQAKNVVARLCEVTGCTEEDCDDLFYPASRDIVIAKAVERDQDARRITKSDFLQKVNRKRNLYTRWHREQVGEDRFVAALKRQIKSSGATNPIKSRFLVADIANKFEDALTIATRLGRDAYGPGFLKTARPWTVLLQGADEQVDEFKRSLLTRSVRLNDGFEHLLVQPQLFDEWPVINTRRQSQKIEAVSYDLRVLSLKTYVGHLDTIKPPDSRFVVGRVTLPGRDEGIYDLTNLPVQRMLELLGVR